MTEAKARTLVWNESAAAPAPLRSSPAHRERALSFAELDRRASEFLALVPWDGPAPDPEAMSAREFLAWL